MHAKDNKELYAKFFETWRYCYRVIYKTKVEQRKRLKELTLWGVPSGESAENLTEYKAKVDALKSILDLKNNKP